MVKMTKTIMIIVMAMIMMNMKNIWGREGGGSYCT